MTDGEQFEHAVEAILIKQLSSTEFKIATAYRVNVGDPYMRSLGNIGRALREAKLVAPIDDHDPQVVVTCIKVWLCRYRFMCNLGLYGSVSARLELEDE